MNRSERWGGIVLCGGASRRMGRPKALLDFCGEPMLLHVARVLQCVLQPIVLVGAKEPEWTGLEPVAGVTWARDQVAERGPLAGIAAGLATLPKDLEGAFVCACDAPLIAPAWIGLLIERIGGADIAMPRALGHRQPLAALYRRQVAETARRLAESGKEGAAGPVRLSDEHPTVFVEEPQLRAVDPELDSLRNANTPEEYDALLGRWREKLGGAGPSP